jgi:hypothetical protein
MRITKRQLKRLIQEEFEYALNNAVVSEQMSCPSGTQQVKQGGGCVKIKSNEKPYSPPEKVAPLANAGKEKKTPTKKTPQQKPVGVVQTLVDAPGKAKKAVIKAIDKKVTPVVARVARQTRKGLKGTKREKAMPFGHFSDMKETKMRITKRQLKRIIKEQVAGTRYTPGTPAGETKTSDDWIDFLQSVIDTELHDMGSSAEAEGHNIGDALEIVRVHFKDLARGSTR